MASSFDRERLRARLLAKGVEWDDDQINSFIDSQQATNKAVDKSLSGYQQLPSSRIVGRSTEPEDIPDLDAGRRWGRPLIQPGPTIEPRNAALDFVGNMLWEAADVTSFGLLGLADEKLMEGQGEEFMTGEEGPSGFAGRAGAGIGGLIGFMTPMGIAKKGAGMAVKGLSSHGTAAAGRAMLKEAGAGELLGKMKTFNKLTQTQKDNVFKPFVETLEHHAKSGALHSAKGREAYTKIVNETFPNVLRDQLKNAGINVRSKEKLKAIEEIVMRNVGGFKGSSLPITTLQQRIAIALGRSAGAGKVANIASHALEEALIFGAVETPMELFNSLEEDRPANYTGTLGHAFTLGSALGLIRMIPGGKGQGIMREGWRRAFGYTDEFGYAHKGILSNKRPFSQYDVKSAADRKALTRYSQSLWKTGNAGKIFSDKGLTKIDEKNIGMFTGSMDDIAKLGETAEGAAKLKQVMMSVENDWGKIWAKEWLKESGKDLAESSGRMIAGAMAFNHDIIFDDYVPLEDKIFNVLVGAYMTKQGRTIEYTGSDGSMKSIKFTERPFTYGDRIKDAAMYLDKMGMDHKALRFQQLVNDYKLREEYFAIDETNDDVKKLVKILNDEGLIVDQDYERTTKVKRKRQGTAGYHSLYEHIMMLADGPLTGSHQRMLRVDELSKKKIVKLERLLQDTEFSNSESGVIESKADVDKIMYSAAEPKLKEMYQIYYDYAKQGFEKMGGVWDVASDGTVEIRMIKPAAGHKISDADQRAFDSYLRVLNVLGRAGGSQKVKINPSEKNYLEATTESFKGLSEIAKRLEDQANKLIYKEGPPIEGGVKLGEELLGTWMESQSYYKGVRDIYDKISDLDNTSGVWGKNADDAKEINRLINTIFVKGKGRGVGLLANSIDVSGGKQGPEKMQLFADALKQVLATHPNYKAPFGLTTETTSQKASYNDVKKLRDLLSKNGMGGFGVENQGHLERFVHDMNRYTMDKQLSRARDSKGKLLNDGQRSKIKYMMESGIVDPQFNIVNIKGVVGALKSAIPAITSSKFRLEKALGGEDMPIEGLYLGNEGLYQVLSNAARINDMEPLDYARKIIDNYERHVEPLMKTEEGKGLLTPSNLEAQVDAPYLSEMVHRMDMIDMKAEGQSHTKLMESIERIRTEGSPESADQKFITAIYHRFWNRQRDTRQLLNILSESGLWNRNRQELELDAPTDPISSIKTAMSKINRIIPFSDTASRVEQRINEHMDNHDMKYDHTDDFKIITPNDFRDKYGVEYDKVREIFDNDKDLDPFETVFKEVKFEGAEYNKLSADQKRQVISDTIGLYRNHINTVNISRIMAGEGVGAIVDNDNTMTNNSLFKSITDIVGEGNFSIVDYNTMTSAGVIDSRRDINAENFLRGVLYDTSMGVNKDFKQSNEIMGARFSFTQESVLVTLPEGSWAIAIPKENLSEISKKFIDVTAAAKKKYGKDTYGQAYKVLEALTGTKVKVDKKAGFKEDVFIYHVDPDVRMLEDPRIIEGDGAARDVWIVKNLEAAQRQLMNMKDGLGGAKNFADTIDAHEGHHILRDKKILKDGTERGDHKHIYVEGDPNIPDGLKPDSKGRESGTDYTKSTTVDDTTYKFKNSTAEQDGHYATAMLTHIWMDKAIGKNWWDVINKGIDGSDPKAFTKLATRFKLMSNVSMYGMDKKLTDMALKHFKDIDGDTDQVKGLKILSKNDGMNIMIAADESGLGKKEFSAYENIRRQMQAELDANTELSGLQDLKDKNWDSADDASMVDSYMPVNKQVMRALEALGAAGNTSGIGGIKPIVHKYAGANGRGVILGKTVFVYSKEFDSFFSNNKNIHAIMFDSAEKMKDPTVSRFDFKEGETLGSLDTKIIGGEFVHKLDFKDIELGAVVKPDHDATISQQIANELTAIEGQSLYSSYISDRLKKYIATVGKAFNEHDPTEAIAFAKHHNSIPETYDGMGAYTRWLKHNGIPFTSPFIQTMKNNVKKVMIDNGGLLTMTTPHGSQSVLVPNLPLIDKSLRNTTFFTPKDGERQIYTYGQIEISNHNRNKAIILDKLRFIKHNDTGKDNTLSFKEFNKGDQAGLIKKSMNLGQAFDAIKDTGYEIAITSYRNPRTRPGDIIISGLRGFLDGEVGNQARINAHDLKMRMEGDFDVDKVNYWWDTPEDLFNKWDALSGEVGAVNPPKNPKSWEGLDFLKPGMIEKFNKDQANASFMRGRIVKMSRMLQFFDNYSQTIQEIVGYDGKKGKFGERKVIMDAGGIKGRLILDADKLRRAKKVLAEDIQTIVDSKTGYDTDLFKDNVWSNKFLYGEKGGERYEGIFTWQEYNGKEKVFEDAPGTLDGHSYGEVAKTAINELIAPYRGLLQVGTGMFEDGKRRSTRYEDLIDASSRFETRMRFASKNAYNKLIKQGIDPTFLNNIFKKNKEWHNPFGAVVANITGDNLLPFERTIREIGRNDGMKVSAPVKMFGEKLGNFERWSNEWIASGDEGSTEAISQIIKQIRSDSKNFGYLNYLDWRIKKQSRIMWEQKRQNNTSLAEAVEHDVARLTDKRNKVQEAIMTDTEVLKMVLSQAQRRIAYEITSNFKTNKWTRDKNFQTYGEAMKWVGENTSTITKWARAEPLKIKGISTSEQMDMIIWNEMLHKWKDIYIMPDFDKLQGQASYDFENDIYNFKKAYSKMWKQLFDDKKRKANKREPWLGESMIMEQAKGMFDELYNKWEGHKEGLGNLALIKIMSPTKDIGSMTYFNGKFVESFQSDSPTYIKFGLRWLANTDKKGELQKDSMFKVFADSYNTLYKTFRGQQAPANDFGHLLYEESVKYNRETMYESPAPLLDSNLKMKWKDTKEYNDILGEINPDVAATFGYNQSFTTGYLLSSRLVGPEWVKYAKEAQAYGYSPSGYIPHDFTGGKFPAINGWDSFNDARYREAKVFFGDALGKDILYVKHNPRVRANFDDAMGTGVQTPKELRETIKNREFDENCL